MGFGLAEVVVGEAEGAFPSIREGFSFASHSRGMIF